MLKILKNLNFLKLQIFEFVAQRIQNRSHQKFKSVLKNWIKVNFKPLCMH